MQSEGIHKNVINATSHAIIYTNEELKIIFVNDGWVNQTGYSKTESLGKTPEQLLAGPDTDKKKLSIINSAVREYKCIQVEIINYKKNGSKYVAFLDIAPIKIDGKDFGWMCVATDITRHKKGIKSYKAKNQKLNNDIQEVLNKYKIREEEIAGLSHDLRTVIHQLSASWELFALEKMNENQRNLHDKASKVLDTAVKLLDEIIRLNKIGYHCETLRLSKIKLYHFIKDCLSEALISEPKENYQIAFNFANMDATVISDRVMMMRVFSNIISNAIKYKKNKLCITVSISDFKSHYRVNIEDDGIGMDENTVKKIFKQYERGINLHSNEIHGHGLGMSIVRSICDELKIEISVNSELNKGSNVSLYIPKALRQ